MERRRDFKILTVNILEQNYLSIISAWHLTISKSIKYMDKLLQKLQEAVAFIQTQTDFKPSYGIILGTGLGNLVSDIDIKSQIDYETIPHFPVSTVESHSGSLIFGYCWLQCICS